MNDDCSPRRISQKNLRQKDIGSPAGKYRCLASALYLCIWLVYLSRAVNPVILIRWRYHCQWLVESRCHRFADLHEREVGERKAYSVSMVMSMQVKCGRFIEIVRSVWCSGLVVMICRFVMLIGYQ